MRKYYLTLVNALIVATTNNFIWFGLTFWIYLNTKSVVSTGITGGVYMIASAFSAFWLGSIVDHHKKKSVMLLSSLVSLAAYTVGYLVYISVPTESFSSITSPNLWMFATILLAGVLSGNLYNIAMPTLVGILVPEDKRDKVNGMYGMMMGIAFAITSFASGAVLAFGGMESILLISIVTTVISLAFLIALSVPEKRIVSDERDKKKSVDLKGTFKVVRSVPGLFALIFFTTFNNFLGGVFMALMDAYGLTLVPVQIWGFIWGFLSFGFIIGGVYIAKKGLGKTPLKQLFRINMVTWTICIFFTIQPSIVLLISGLAVWMCLVPFIEATEQTIIQKVVPTNRQGRVFGFAQSIEQAASPLTAFLIGPIAQYIFIPFMTTGTGVELIGSWFGVGPGRGMALVFSLAGIIGLVVTMISRRSNSYKLLARRYEA